MNALEKTTMWIKIMLLPREVFLTTGWN